MIALEFDLRPARLMFAWLALKPYKREIEAAEARGD